MALKPIIPKKPIANVDKHTAAFFSAIDEETESIKRDFEKTTRTWKTRVKFRVLKARKRGKELIGAAGTDNKIYGYVTRGTRPHIIRPRNGGVLAFQSGYSAKTRRGLIGSATGGAFGATVFSRGVKHPGTQARDFEITIAKAHQKSFENNIKRKLTAALKTS